MPCYTLQEVGLPQRLREPVILSFDILYRSVRKRPNFIQVHGFCSQIYLGIEIGSLPTRKDEKGASSSVQNSVWDSVPAS